MRTIAAAIALAVSSAAIAQNGEPTLRVGDEPPKIDISHWLTPGVTNTTSITPGDGKIYVLDFWATWCAPCIAAFPDISRLQSETIDDGVVIISLSDEDIATVNRFLDKTVRGADAPWRERLTQTFATDVDLSTQNEILYPMGGIGFPTIVVIGRDGRLEWIGIPAIDPVEPVIEALLAGEWDRESQIGKDLLNPAPGDKEFSAALEAMEWETAATLARGDWRKLSNVAYSILLRVSAPTDDLMGLATVVSDESIRIVDGGDALPYHVRAMLHWRAGEKQAAIDLQRKTVQIAIEKSSPWLEAFESTLASYESEAGPASGG